MRKVKIFFWFIIAVLVLAFVYQNWSFLSHSQKIVIHIVYGYPYTIELPVAIYLLTFFFVGFLIAYFLNLAQRFHSKKAIRQLNETIEVQKKKISELEDKIAAARGGEAASIYSNTNKQANTASS